jgi:hypothetical protein
MLEARHDLEVSGTMSNYGGSVTAAYALTGHFGLLASSSLSAPSSPNLRGNQWGGELGCGLFDSPGPHFTYSFFAAAGWGASSFGEEGLELNFFDMDSTRGDEQVHFWNAWMQGSVGYKGKIASISFLTRITYVNMYQDIITTYNSYFYPTYWSYSESTRYFLLIPGVQLQFGWEHVKINASLYVLSSLSESGNYPIPMIGLVYKL